MRWGRSGSRGWIAGLKSARMKYSMLTPDGALVTFPAAPLDGSEVRADGRPWLLSFVDGAYRVRDGG